MANYDPHEGRDNEGIQIVYEINLPPDIKHVLSTYKLGIKPELLQEIERTFNTDTAPSLQRVIAKYFYFM